MTDQELGMLLGEINERTKSIEKQITLCATIERVDAVKDRADQAYNKIDDHIKEHQSLSINRNLILGSYIGGIAAAGTALVAIFKK